MRKIYIVLAAMALVSAIPFLIDYMLQDVKELPTSVGVGNYLGFNVDTDQLYFGVLPRSGVSTREFYVENLNCGKCLVEIEVDGELAKLLSLSEYKFILNKGEKKTISATVTLPSDIKETYYNGTIRMLFWKTF